ncbi:hypothetical protein L1887_36134 [Cichorium endivia]|nr:hypothetical protein L1887_36134 [Cichorium endivia]
MAGLIVMKGISLIYASEERYYEKVTGSRVLPDLLIYVQQCISSLRLFIVILLIVYGWPLVKPCLQLIDDTVFSITIPVRILAEIVSIVIGEPGDVKNWSIWNEMILTVDIINPCLIMVPFTRSLLSNHGIGSRVSSRLELVRTVHVIVSLYLLATRAFTLVRINVTSMELKMSVQNMVDTKVQDG